VTEQLKREVGRDLWLDAQLSEAEFTVLANLRLAPEGVRPGSCARAIGWDSSRLSHQLRRLEKRGLVTRKADPHDGRGAVVVLTGLGLSAYRRAIGPHLRSAQKWFAEAMTPQQMDALGDALEALQVHIAQLSQSRPEDER